MNDEEKLDIWKRKKIGIEGKIREIGSYRDVLLNLLNEVRANKNVKLNNSLKDLDLEEEISHLEDWIKFHEKEVLAYEDKIKSLEKEVSEQKSEAAKEEAELKESLEEIEKEELEYEKKQLHESGEETKEPDEEILKHELEDLEKESKDTGEKEPEHNDEPEKTPEIEIPSKEEIEREWEKEQFEKEAEELELEAKEAAKSAYAEKSEEKEKEIEKLGVGIKDKEEDREEDKVEEKQQEAAREPSKIDEFFGVEEKGIEKQWGKEERKIEAKEEETREQTKKLFKERKPRIKEKLALIKGFIRDAFRGKKIHNRRLVNHTFLIILLLLVTSILFIYKPEITGYVTLTKEKTYIDNLNLIINESGNYTWIPDNIGNIQSIKAAGRVRGNGTVKIYIEKDGERYLVYGNKKG